MNIFINQENPAGTKKEKNKKNKQTYLSEIHTQNNEKQSRSVDNSVNEVYLKGN